MREFIAMGDAVQIICILKLIRKRNCLGMDHSPDGYGPWGTIYGVIAITNIVIGADHASLEGNPAEIDYIVGQAHAIRALCHFDLLRNYGQHFIDGQGGANSLGVPYVKTYKDPAN